MSNDGMSLFLAMLAVLCLVFVAATAHRLVLHGGGTREAAKETATRILSTVPVP